MCVYVCIYICDIYRFLSIFKKFRHRQEAQQANTEHRARTSKHFYLGHISSGTSLVTRLPSPGSKLLGFTFIFGERQAWGDLLKHSFSAKVLKALINLWHLMSACNELIVCTLFGSYRKLLNVSDSCHRRSFGNFSFEKQRKKLSSNCTLIVFPIIPNTRSIKYV